MQHYVKCKVCSHYIPISEVEYNKHKMKPRKTYLGYIECEACGKGCEVLREDLTDKEIKESEW